jgi:hypothetical protein
MFNALLGTSAAVLTALIASIRAEYECYRVMSDKDKQSFNYPLELTFKQYLKIRTEENETVISEGLLN